MIEAKGTWNRDYITVNAQIARYVNGLRAMGMTGAVASNSILVGYTDNFWIADPRKCPSGQTQYKDYQAYAPPGRDGLLEIREIGKSSCRDRTLPPPPAVNTGADPEADNAEGQPGHGDPDADLAAGPGRGNDQPRGDATEHRDAAGGDAAGAGAR